MSFRGGADPEESVAHRKGPALFVEAVSDASAANAASPAHPAGAGGMTIARWGRCGIAILVVYQMPGTNRYRTCAAYSLYPMSSS